MQLGLQIFDVFIRCIKHLTQHSIENMLHVWHFSSGWLGKTEVQELKTETSAVIATYWNILSRDVDWDVLWATLGGQAKSIFMSAERDMEVLIDNLLFDCIRDDWNKCFLRLRERLPENLAQLDEISDEEAVPFVFWCLEETDRSVVQERFRRGFWSELKVRETGEMAGLAFLLFMYGLARDRHAKKGRAEERMKHFLGQFRDGIHIENAARCEMFITFDKGAARLARSIYDYAGVKAKVVELKVVKQAAG